MPEPWTLLATVVVLLATGILVWRPIRTVLQETRFADARREFHLQRERLEVKFVCLAQTRPSTDAWCWADCEFDDDVAYVRNRYTGELSAFVGVLIAAANSDERNQNLRGNLQAATAVFKFRGGRWDTNGRVIFNLSPAEAIRFYHRDLKMVGQEPAQRMPM